MSFVENTELKYITGYFREIEGFPNKEDIVYLATKRAMDKGKSIDPVVFTFKNMSKSLGTFSTEVLHERLEQMLNSGSIEISREGKDGNSYRILKNQYT